MRGTWVFVGTGLDFGWGGKGIRKEKHLTVESVVGK